MSAQPSDPNSSSIRALFSKYFAQFAAGDAPDPDACEREVLDRLFPLDSLERRVVSRFGRGVDPGISLQDGPDPERGDDEHARGQPGHSRISSARYRRQGEVARGGMGVILRVWDRDIRRNLAMKVIRGVGREPDRERVGRFLEEAQITGQLDHPGIVPVHEVGIDGDGKLYFTMRLVRGRDLSQVFRWVESGRNGWTVTRVLGLLLKACEAIAYAHSKGVIHRDLKPSNVMVGRFGQVYVMDWGLAKVVDPSKSAAAARERRLDAAHAVSTGTPDEARSFQRAGSTVLGTVLGTPAYMPPEQALGRIDKIGRYSDVYSVGAILYHLLTGQPPYVGPHSDASAAEVIERVRRLRPRRIQKIAPDVPAELVAICEKAMARQPRDRYPNMGRMAEDLRAYLEGRVVRAHKTGALVEFRKWVLRNRGTATAILTAVLVAFGGLSGVSVVQARSKDALEAKNTELESAVTEAVEARTDLERNERRLSDAVAELVVLRETAEEAAERARREADTAEHVLAFMGELFQAQDPTASLRSGVTASEILQSAKGRLDVLPHGEVRTRVLLQLVRAFHTLDEYDSAEELVDQALRTLRGVDHDASGLLDHLVNRARLLTESGTRPSDAVYLWTVLEEQFSAHEGRRHPRALACRAGRASVNSRNGAVADATQELEEVLRIVDGSRFEKLAWTVQARYDLAAAYEQSGRHDAAGELYRRVLAKMDDLSGNDRVGLDLKRRVAAYCARVGDFQRAERLYRETIVGWLGIYAEFKRPTYERALACSLELGTLLGRQVRPDPATLEVLDRVAAKRSAGGDFDRRTVEIARRLVQNTPEEDPALDGRRDLLEAVLSRAERD